MLKNGRGCDQSVYLEHISHTQFTCMLFFDIPPGLLFESLKNMKCKGVWTLDFFLSYNSLPRMSILAHASLRFQRVFLTSLTHPSLHKMFLSWKLFWGSSNYAKVSRHPCWRVFIILNYFQSAPCVQKVFSSLLELLGSSVFKWQKLTCMNWCKEFAWKNVSWILSHLYILQAQFDCLRVWIY